jgi:hypothetical protein
MLKIILIVIGAVIINYLPLWAAEQINWKSEKFGLKLEED